MLNVIDRLQIPKKKKKKKKKIKNFFWKWENHLLSMHKVGIRLVCIQVDVITGLLKPKCYNLYEFQLQNRIAEQLRTQASKSFTRL